jgi:hypothetical protein
MPAYPAVARRFRACCLAACSSLAAIDAGAQRGSISGVVSDSARAPIRDAEVSLMSLGRMTRTDTGGRFAFADLPRGQFELSVRRLGFQIQRVQVVVGTASSDPVSVTMLAQPTILNAVGVSATEERHPFLEEFDKRRTRGVGTFITREQITARNSDSPSDLMRTIPGLRLVRAGSGYGVRFQSTTGMRRGSAECAPTIWVDGQRAQGMEIDDLRSSDIVGIEIYRGVSTTPPQFASNSLTQCGAIVVWTRRKR